MNEVKPTSGWNEAKPSFPPDDLSAPVSPGGGHLGSREVSRIEYEQRRRIYHLEAEVARLRDALPFLRAVASALESDPTNEVEFTVGSLGIEHEGSIRKALAAKGETK